MTPIVRQIQQLEFQLTEVEARQLTDDIKETAEQLWSLLERAFQGKAWKALGYASWEVYVKTEFDMSRRRSYQVLDQAKVIRAIEDAANVNLGTQSEMSTSVDISEREARDIKPIIDQVTTRIQEEVLNVPREQVQSIVQRVVQEEREKINQERQLRQDNVELHEKMGWPTTKVDVEAEDARLKTVYHLYDALEHLTELPPPPDFLALVKPYEMKLLANIPSAITWLQSLAQAMENSK